MRLETGADEVRTAREAVADRLRAWGLASSVDVARVLTSELVTNALLHGQPPITLEVRRTGNAVRVEVTDCGDGRPAPRSVDLERPGGMGLVIVDSLASSWGVVAAGTGVGTTVWFELASAPA
jgi:anti-sigma regulatory factor (Ser/Thr protein kinase)